MVKCQLTRMFTSIIISGGNQKQRKEKALFLRKKTNPLPLEKDPDTSLIFPNKNGKISIDKIRSLKKWLQRKPFQASKKIAIIEEAEKLTLPAQNAFLKTLEEPPAHSLLLLTTANYHLLLPTVVSRCHLIKIKPISFAQANNSIFTLPLSKRVKIVSSINRREELNNLLSEEKNYWQKRIKKDPHRALFFLKNILRAEEMAAAFVTPSLVAYWLLLKNKIKK